MSDAVSVPPDVFLLGVVSEIEIALDRVIAGKKPFPPFKGRKLMRAFFRNPGCGAKLEPTSEQAARSRSI